ncbi:MAG TPA: hypothetical protein VFW50_28685 [Streptosporangiaceae bacterium]|nr:hypothetical protein [Streptosporangiaceae bacterium]
MTVVSGLTETTKDIAPNGVLRAAINLGNPVLAQGTPAAPAGVTADIARELGTRLGVPVDLACFAAARESFLVDQGFMQIRQALGTALTRTPDTIRFLAAFIEDLKASGFIAAALRRSGQDPALVAPSRP